MENPPQDYRRNVGICLINPSRKIFAASRLDIPNAWQMPQGGIDKNEDPRTAVMRELREETRVTSADIVAEVPYWLTHDFPPEFREKLKQQWGSDWKGRAHKW
ncbi:nudix hydrolase 26, chloroplastic-like [Henckelia pumila]|uniref:nudix hydrolase 26, chloroplastic-like n=1 Tax=Henckelia pumila TaxID=405737 RepID=UPI003C6DDD76